MKHDQGFINILLAIVIIVAVVGTAGYFILTERQTVSNETLESQISKEQLNQDKTINWKIYRHNTYDIKYPENFDIFAEGEMKTLITPRSSNLGIMFIAKNDLRGQNSSRALVRISSSISTFKTISELEVALKKSVTNYNRVELNGKQALEIKSDTHVITLLIAENTSFEISMRRDASEEELNTVRTIVSTLKPIKSTSAADNSRDTKRLNDLKLYKMAMELYYSEKVSTYPKTMGDGFVAPLPATIKTSLKSYLAIASPDDPNGAAYGYWWLNGTDGTNYCIYAAGTNNTAPGGGLEGRPNIYIVVSSKGLGFRSTVPSSVFDCIPD